MRRRRPARGTLRRLRPDRSAQRNRTRRILRRYLRALDTDVDCSRVAAETDGWPGADLGELVTRALLCASDAVVCTALVLQLVRESGRARGPGTYH